MKEIDSRTLQRFSAVRKKAGRLTHSSEGKKTTASDRSEEPKAEPLLWASSAAPEWPTGLGTRALLGPAEGQLGGKGRGGVQSSQTIAFPRRQQKLTQGSPSSSLGGRPSQSLSQRWSKGHSHEKVERIFLGGKLTATMCRRPVWVIVDSQARIGQLMFLFLSSALTINRGPNKH